MATHFLTLLMTSIPVILFTMMADAGMAQQVTAGFICSDTVCVNTPFIVSNITTEPANTYFWEACSSATLAAPVASNLGNPTGASFSNPVYFDVQEDAGNYYMFMTNNLGNTISRLSFGNSLLNTPTATNLGNPSGAFSSQPE